MSTLSNQLLRALSFLPRSARSEVVAFCAAVLALSMIGPGVALAACDATCQAQFVTEHNRVRTRLNNGQMPAPVGTQPIVRYLFGLRGNSLIAGAVGGSNPQRATVPLIEAYILTLRP